MKLKFIPYILFFLLAASCQEKGSKPDTIQQEYKPHIIDLSEATQPAFRSWLLPTEMNSGL